ncbi:MAG TPA: nitrile hydratase subunit beta [Candidatus Binataceae bacterium]|nr:nitrile hydratase subunit beta [Candidatus Binataceae bacterium]
MNGVHDLGGMHGFGPVIREPNEPVFHSEWEKRMFAMTLTAMGRRVCNVDEFRRAIERMPPAGYLATSYYEKWLYAVESLLVEKGVATREEIASGHAAAPVSAKATGSLDAGGGRVESFDNSAVKLRFNKSFKPGFRVGDRVVARNLNPEHHTRLPRYARGKRGVIRYDQGVFVFPDTHAHGQGTKPQHVYTVAFEARELWGADHDQRAQVYVDCWEAYLERARIAAKPAVKSAAKTAGKAVSKTKTSPAKFAAKGHAAKPAAKSTSRSRAAVKKGRKR